MEKKLKFRPNPEKCKKKIGAEGKPYSSMKVGDMFLVNQDYAGWLFQIGDIIEFEGKRGSCFHFKKYGLDLSQTYYGKNLNKILLSCDE